tara:strand:- start:996 stop:1901 length:906 start_codon:yes stop_codon:yes gene_type:complete
MNIKITYHLMPWEIDYALLSFSQLKKSKYFLSEEDNVTIETVLNLSSYIIDWDKSQLPKEFFIEKYDQISKLLNNYTHIKRTYEGEELYGHLNLQKECISTEADYYINICPDIYFHEHLLAQIIEGAKQVPNKYFVITPQISKLWDSSWDILVNPSYQHLPYEKWNEVDTFDIIYKDTYHSTPSSLKPINKSKYAGWFDLYNKNFYENLVPVWEDWEGYGSWDWYSLIVTEEFKNKGGDFQQYLLEGKTIFEYSVGPLKDNGFTHYYKKFLSLNPIPDQKENFKNKVPYYARTRINQLLNK